MVNEYLQTSDPDIFAVGDAISVKHVITGEAVQIPLAGPANRQGRIAAENALGRRRAYGGSLGTSVVKVFAQTAAGAGLTERRLREAGVEYEKIYLHPFAHATYYPGATPLSMKLLFNREGRILGVQAVGGKGVEKRVDVIATAIRGGLTVYDLEELELAYAPPYGSAKDPVNYAGMVAANVLRGDTTPVHVDDLPADAWLLDVRQPEEHELGAIPGSTLIPLGELRSRLEELPRDRRIVIYCAVGIRGYLAERILKQRGFDVANLSGGWKTWRLFHPVQPASPAPSPTENFKEEPAPMPAVAKFIDVSSMQCPGPIVRLRGELESLNEGDIIELKAVPAFDSDLRAWCAATGNELLAAEMDGDFLVAQVRKGNSPSDRGAAQERPDTAAIVVFSNDLDKVMAAFIIATGLATMGTKVSMFFTFWGLNVLRKPNPPSVTKDLLSRMFGFMMPRGARKLALSKMHMAGMGTAMMKYVMNRKNVSSLPELITKARELGVKFIACEMAMNVMGLQRAELLDDVDDVAGVAAFAALARESGTTLFI